jgi:hypothetical protein
MTGTGFGLGDIVSRVEIDTGVRLGQDMIQILQAELGLVKPQPRLELQGRLISHGISVLDAAGISAMIFENPVKVGIELAGRGLMGKGSRVLLGVPRNIASACKAGAELWRVANGQTTLSLGKLQRLMAEANVKKKDIDTLFPGKAAAFHGAEIRVEIPGGANPFKGFKASSARK